MKKNKTLRRIIIMTIVLLFALFIALIVILLEVELSKDNDLNVSITFSEEDNSNISVVTSRIGDLTTIKEVVEKHNSTYISEDDNYIYVWFAEDLYDEEGKSNKSFFVGISYDLAEFFKEKDFYIIDRKLNIEVYMQYDEESEEHLMFINQIEDFYENIDGETYTSVDNINYAEESEKITSVNDLLTKLKSNRNEVFKY